MQQNNKKKILYVITKSNWGGAQRYVYDLATNLPKKEFEVKVVLGGEGELKKKLEDANITTINIRTLGRDIGIIKDIASLFTLIKIFYIEKPHVVHLNSSKAGGLGTLAARAYNFLVWLSSFFHAPRSTLHATRIIFTAHGWAWNEERPEWQRWTIKASSWFTVMLCHRTIVVSDYDGKQAERMLFVKNKIVRIHNGISAVKYASKKAAQENLLGEDAKKFSKAIWVGTVAELHKNKGLEYAIEAFRKLCLKKESLNIIWVIIGDGEKREHLQEMITNAKLQKKIFLVGHKDSAARILRGFDIFLLPSIKEGLPYVILEAGIAGIPVIASAVGGIPEIIEDMKTGILVKPGNPEEIGLALDFLALNKDKQKTFAEKMGEKINDTFSFKEAMEQTTGLYRV